MPQIIKANEDRLRRDIESLSEFTDPDANGYTRISFSHEDRQARNHIHELMEREAGLDVHVDSVGNMIGRREGKLAGPCIMVGSHLDTVPGGGRFDGIVGVVAGWVADSVVSWVQSVPDPEPEPQPQPDPPDPRWRALADYFRTVAVAANNLADVIDDYEFV